MTTPEKLNQKGAKKLVPWQRPEKRTNDILVAFVAGLESKKERGVRESHARGACLPPLFFFKNTHA